MAQLLKVRLLTSSDEVKWDAYVHRHPDSTHCHLSGWKHVIENTYRHRAYYLLAETGPEIVGALPLFHIKSPLFGNQLVSMPFLDYGGVIGNSPETIGALEKHAMELAIELKTNSVELRYASPLKVKGGTWFPTGRNKMRMVLQLPPSSEDLFRSFKAKLRSQIRRPQKEGMKGILGGSELLGSFYDVFSTNMRDLGSPVHSSKLFQEVCKYFDARVSVISQENRPTATAIMITFKDTAQVPWASSLWKYNGLSPNMLLYWQMLEYACDQKYRYFDFGRSSSDEGTYRFKEQWGAIPAPLSWRYTLLDHSSQVPATEDKSKFNKAVHYWKKLPVPVANLLGPMIRKYISL